MVLGTLLACPHCGDCIEILGEVPKPQHELICDCGGLLEPVEGKTAAPPAPRPTELGL